MSNTVERLTRPLDDMYPIDFTTGYSHDKSRGITVRADQCIEMWHESTDGLSSSCVTVQLSPEAWKQLTEFMQEVGE